MPSPLRHMTVLHRLAGDGGIAPVLSALNALEDADLSAEELHTAEDLGQDRVRAVVLVVDGAGLQGSFAEGLRDHLAAQPSWSSLPVLLLLDDPSELSAEVVELRGGAAKTNLAILFKPWHPLEIETALRSAIRARRRQFDVDELLQREQELRHEIDHRMKNQLSTVMAIYNLSRGQSGSLQELDDIFGPRIKALNAVHDLLRQSPRDAVSLGRMCDEIFLPFGGEGDRRIVVEGDSPTLDRDRALITALMLNELATNAAKHGALSTDRGEVRLHARAVEASQIELYWREENGPAVSPPQRLSYGTSFIQRSAAMLGGHALFDYAPGGLKVDIALRQKSGN